MYQAGDYVMYAGNGLCLVESVGVPNFQPSGNAVPYYYLRTADDRDRIYVPVNNTALPIRDPLTSHEAEALLAELPSMQIDLPPKRDQKVMVKLCKEMLQPQTARAMARTMKMLYVAHPAGKMSSDEEKILKRTESCLRDELAYALKISVQEASRKLSNALKEGERE